MQGCDNNNTTQGEVARDVTFFCLPCGPCTAGAGTCANPLSVPGSGRIQFHGRVTGASNLTGPCTPAAAGPESVFRFVPTTSGCYEFSTCGTSFDSQLSLGEAFCSSNGSIVEQCMDDNTTCADSTQREYNFGSFAAGQPITFVLDSESSQGGSYTFDVRPSGACFF